MEKSKVNTVSIGEAARQCGCSRKQIRYWEARNLIPPSQRVTCGERHYRQYSEADLRVIKAVKSYLDQGYTLPIALIKASQKLCSATALVSKVDLSGLVSSFLRTVFLG